MSEKNSKNNQNIEMKKNIKNNKETKEQIKKEEEEINPLTLLSKDLLEEINSLEEIDFNEKKDSINDDMNIDETQKESEINDEEDDYILEIEKEMDKDIFSYEIFKNDENEKLNESKNNKKENPKQGRLSQPIPNPHKFMNFNSNQIGDTNFFFTIGRLSYDYPQYQNKNDSFNIQINTNPLQNNINLYNNSFTMNGKSGWVCAFCKNFNYESKFNSN